MLPRLDLLTPLSKRIQLQHFFMTNLLLLLPGTRHCIPSIPQLLHTLSPASLTRSLRSTSHRTFRLRQLVHAIDERFFFSGLADSPFPSDGFLFFGFVPGDCVCGGDGLGGNWASEELPTSPTVEIGCSSPFTADRNNSKDDGSIVILRRLFETRKGYWLSTWWVYEKHVKIDKVWKIQEFIM